MAQSIDGAWAALYAACQTLYVTDDTSAVVVAGDPGVYQADLIVSFMEMREPRTRPTSGGGRSRDLLAEIDILFSKFAAGGDEAQQAVIADAHAAAAQLETYLRTSPNEKLGGACYDSWLSTANLRPYIVWADERLDDGSLSSVAVGRAADLVSTVTVRVRL